MLYQLSKVIPIPMKSFYGLIESNGTCTPYSASWWQWRDRIYRNRVVSENDGIVVSFINRIVQ